MLYVAIDPGLVSGAYGVVTHSGAYHTCGMIPNVDGRIDVRAFRAELSNAIDMQDYELVIEDVFVRPAQSATAQAKYMRAVGAIETVCMLRGPVHLVTPSKWKKDMGLTKDKSSSLNMARALWDKAPVRRAKDHNLAEALLLAEWLRRENT